ALGIVAGATTNPLSLRLEKSVALLQRQHGDVKASLSVLRSTLNDRAYVRERDRQSSGAQTKPAKK
ncbi:MAG: hypothetical protein ACK47U_11060, partial [Verrucomicrobiota bacterium]